jgi:hypothetical protein
MKIQAVHFFKFSAMVANCSSAASWSCFPRRGQRKQSRDSTHLYREKHELRERDQNIELSRLNVPDGAVPAIDGLILDVAESWLLSSYY